MDLAEAAKKAAVVQDRLAAWESGADQPTVKQLRKLGEVYKRPLAVFYLPEPPPDFQLAKIKDFRRLPDSATSGFSTELRFELRRALFRRDVALQMMENVAQAPEPFLMQANLRDNPEDIGQRVRDELAITREKQARWSGAGYDAFNEVRDAVETKGALVFQASVSLEEMRGVAVYYDLLPVILVSAKEQFMAPRLFTLLHELVHLMLRCSAISNGAEDELVGEAGRIEIFANHAAGAALVPMSDLLNEPEVAGRRPNATWDDAQIEQIARRYRVGKETLLRRLLIAGRVTRESYKTASKRWQDRFALLPKRRAEGAPPVHVTELSRVGRLFPRLVLQNYHQEKITGPELSEYLNLKLKHLSQVEAELRAKPSWAY